MDEKLQGGALPDSEKTETASPKAPEDERAGSRPAPRCPDNYRFEDGM